MKTLRTQLSNERGFSFLEVMVALVLTAIVTTAVFRTYIVQHENYMTQDDITNVQQNTRAALAELTRHLRMAGYALPASLDALAPKNSNPDTVTITYRTNDCQSSLSAKMTSASADIFGDTLTSISCFHTGEWAYIYHPDSGGGEWFQINSVDTTTHKIKTAGALSRAYWKGSIVITVNQVKFYIDKTTDVKNPRMMMQLKGGAAQVYAENISDLQFRYRMTTGAILDAPTLIDQIAEVIVSVTGSSASEITDGTGKTRQRTFTTSVFLRNNTL